jgi:heterodisulfide reductase subunit C
MTDNSNLLKDSLFHDEDLNHFGQIITRSENIEEEFKEVSLKEEDKKTQNLDNNFNKSTTMTGITKLNIKENLLVDYKGEEKDN